MQSISVISLFLVDESSNPPGDQQKRSIRHDSVLADDIRQRSGSNTDELQSDRINFFPARRSVIKLGARAKKTN